MSTMSREFDHAVETLADVVNAIQNGEQMTKAHHARLESAAEEVAEAEKDGGDETYLADALWAIAALVDTWRDD